VNWAPKSEEPPAGYSYGPVYRPSKLNVARAILYILRGRQRSLAHDALLGFADAPAPPLVRGLDLVPEAGPLVLAANHYERPGLWMAWPAMLAGMVVRERTGEDTHWIAIEEWESFSLWRIPIPRPVIREVFHRAFSTYGILAMPPPDASVAARAGAMRDAARYVKNGMILGLMPEGTVGATPELLPAREGAGAFLLLLAAAGARIVPTGFYEEGGRLAVHFREPLALKPPTDLPKDERDLWARETVMRAIRDVLPRQLWGSYAD
jgi:1-acyl-sn-glycerol-3-phosphate acyltransferase